MIINELNLLGFGRFENKKINLEEGLNIIYGENETGKTTVHNFINGMFYGFLRPYVKRAIYLDEHDMYRPWSGKKYAGILKFETDNRSYIIERKFTRAEEETRVLVEDTGENITKDIQIKDKTRIVQPGNYFFGFNDAVYGNTISVKQSSNKVEDDLSKEIKDKLVNLSTSMDNELSTEKAINALDGAIKEIGTIRAHTSYYGKIYKNISSLEKEEEEILKNKDEYLKALDDKSQIEKDMDIETKELRVLEERLRKSKFMEKLKIYHEAKSIKEEIEALKKDKERFRKYKDFSLNDYLKGIKMDREIDGISKRIIELKEDLTHLENMIKEIEREKRSARVLDRTIEEDFLKFEKLEEEKIAYANTNDNELEFLKRDIKESLKKEKNIKNILLVSGLAFILSLVLAYVLYRPILWVNLVSLPLMVYSFIKARSIRADLGEEETKLEKLDKDREDKILVVGEINEKQDRILDKYKAESKLDLKRIFDEYNMASYGHREDKKLVEDYKSRKAAIEKSLEGQKEVCRDLTKDLKTILTDNFSASLEDFKEGVDKAGLYKESQAKIQASQSLFYKTIGDKTFEQLEKECEGLKINSEDLKDELPSSVLQARVKEKYESLSQIKIKMASNDSRIEFLDRSISKLVQIEESIYNGKKLLEEADKKIKSLDLARDTIARLSKDIQREFAPVLNKRVGSIIDKLTRGRYKHIKIDDKLQMGIVDSKSGEIIDLNDLSGGTIDQLYFSLRFGIINSLTDKKPPLILDDCFVQYDNNRLENMLELLLEEAETRQIILFTCHKREGEILSKREENFNLINLQGN